MKTAGTLRVPPTLRRKLRMNIRLMFTLRKNIPNTPEGYQRALRWKYEGEEDLVFLRYLAARSPDTLTLLFRKAEQSEHGDHGDHGDHGEHMEHEEEHFPSDEQDSKS